MIQPIEARSILSRLRGKDNFFGISYSMNLYRGCQHGCIYCDTRSECYGIVDISQLKVKKNALELLGKEISSKKQKGTVGTGSMNDPYMPVEKELEICRGALKIIRDKHFPVHIITKSTLVTRDMDILQDISKTYAAVSVTITTSDNELSQKIEPHAPKSSDRFQALKSLAEKGIYTGITLMPLLPFINDTQENLKCIFEKAKDSGISYIIPMLGLTLRKGSREYFYGQLDNHFPGKRLLYETTFGDRYECNSPHYTSLASTLNELSDQYKIPLYMRFFKPVINEQLSIF